MHAVAKAPVKCANLRYFHPAITDPCNSGRSDPNSGQTVLNNIPEFGDVLG